MGINTIKIEKYSEILVQRVNELYHDLYHDEYHDTHNEIIELERKRWERLASKFIYYSKPITILDIGTGSGFVPLTIASLLKQEDVFICSDISRNTLNTAEANIKKQTFCNQFKFIKIDTAIPYSLTFESQSVDVVTINSVLHHIKDTDTFINEIDRVLRKDGLIFIGHEPNNYFYNNKFLWSNYSILNFLLSGTQNIKKVFKKFKIEKPLKKIYYLIYPEKKEISLKHLNKLKKLNEQLIEEELIETPLHIDEIGRITDIKSRTGFKPDSILQHYKILYSETYNHIFWVSINYHNNLLISKYDNLLKSRYPDKGATFFVILKKEK